MKTPAMLLLSCALASVLGAEAVSRLIVVPDVVAHAQLAALEGRPEEALAELKALVTLAPGDADAWLALGMIHKDLGQKKEAAQCLAKVRELLPQEAETLIKEADAVQAQKKEEVREAQVVKGVLGYKVVTGTVKDVERPEKPSKWTRKYDLPKPVDVEAAVVADGAPGTAFAPPTAKLAKPRARTTPVPLEALSVGPKITEHP